MGGVYTTRESYLKVYSQFQEGGLSEVLKNRDIIDASVSTVTTGIQGAAFLGMGVNPIVLSGAGILSIGYGIYSFF
ncbi:hypothetical protein GO491_01145 [Flavobacteriaceae bacterium Ap0902]|nr:hypothetical protein [Flavobacteriaceae bacterium Ap0902]